MQQSYYNDYYTLEREHWWFQIRAKIIMNRISKIASGGRELKILNVGVATGFTSEMLAQFGSVKSVEYNEDCYEFLKEKLNIDVVKASILELPFEDNSYDLVCAFDVIEHVDDDSLATKELKRVTKLEGSVIVTVPALMLLWSMHDEINHHYRRYTSSSLKKLFIGSGKITKCTYFNYFLFFPIAVFRIISGTFRVKQKSGNRSGSDFSVASGKLIGRVLHLIFYTEYLLLRAQINFPIGVSILLDWKKTQK